MRKVPPKRVITKGSEMATATATKPAGKAKIVKAKDPSIPDGFRKIRGRLIPIGKRRPIAERIKDAENKLVAFDNKYAEGRQKLIDRLENIKSRYANTAKALELTQDKTAAEAMVDVEAKLADLLAARRALKSVDPSLKRPKPGAGKGKSKK